MRCHLGSRVAFHLRGDFGIPLDRLVQQFLQFRRQKRAKLVRRQEFLTGDYEAVNFVPHFASTSTKHSSIRDGDVWTVCNGKREHIPLQGRALHYAVSTDGSPKAIAS